MRVAVAALVLAALVGGFFMPAAADYTNGTKQDPAMNLQLLGVQPLLDGRVLIVSLAEHEGRLYLFAMLIRPDGTREGAIMTW